MWWFPETHRVHACCLLDTAAEKLGLPVLRMQEPPPLIGARAEVQIPRTVIPFQLNLPPSQRNLRIGIERSDVRPGTGTVLLRIGDLCVVGIRRIGGPCIRRQTRIVENRRRGARCGECTIRRRNCSRNGAPAAAVHPDQHRAATLPLVRRPEDMLHLVRRPGGYAPPGPTPGGSAPPGPVAGGGWYPAGATCDPCGPCG